VSAMFGEHTSQIQVHGPRGARARPRGEWSFYRACSSMEAAHTHENGPGGEDVLVGNMRIPPTAAGGAGGCRVALLSLCDTIR